MHESRGIRRMHSKHFALVRYVHTTFSGKFEEIDILWLRPGRARNSFNEPNKSTPPIYDWEVNNTGHTPLQVCIVLLLLILCKGTLDFLCPCGNSMGVDAEAIPRSRPALLPATAIRHRPVPPLPSSIQVLVLCCSVLSVLDLPYSRSVCQTRTCRADIAYKLSFISFSTQTATFHPASILAPNLPRPEQQPPPAVPVRQRQSATENTKAASKP